jgi:D-glycero-D-manno-heptose 1,7-bisphosphate phosphatase
VLTEPVWNPATSAYESANRVSDVALCPGSLEAMRALQAAGFELFIVSNQPSYAKGKVSLEELQAIGREVDRRLAEAGIQLRQAYYCYHHPEGIVAEYTGPCECRKPGTSFLRHASHEFGIDLRRSWMIGDRDTDVECGQRAGCRTIRVAHPHSDAGGSPRPDYTAENLLGAVPFIVPEGARTPVTMRDGGTSE